MMTRSPFPFVTLSLLSAIILGGSFPTETVAEEPVASPRAFSLPGLDGKPIEFAASTASKLTVVCFVGAECPLARLYGPRLQALTDRHAKAGVTVIGISSNRQDSVDDLKEYARDHRLTFPIGKDYENRVADRYGAERTPEVFVLDRKLNVVYRGRIDDQFLPGITRPEPTRDDLRIAIEELLRGNPVTVPRTEAVGCLIGRVEAGEVTTEITYADEVSRILNRHCVECHRAGEIGPFALTDYEEVVGWGAMMMEVIDDGRMPPWHAAPTEVPLANERHMPKTEIETLREWVDGGMPFGESDDLPPAPAERIGWQIGTTPDLVLPMRNRPYTVPAEGIVEYQYFVVDPGFEEDTWVVAAEVQPGNRSVVHHCIVFVRPPDGTGSRGVGWLTAYVPGQKPMPYPKGYGRRVPAGSRLVFQMHYTPTGTEEEDLTRVGLVLGNDEEITHEVMTLSSINHDFEIPPHAANFEVTDSYRRLPSDGELLAIAPHMHVRGKRFAVDAVADGKPRRILEVPKYDFNWQHTYVLTDPLPLNTLDELRFTARFDNSKKNPVNPDPTQYVGWGDQTFEEMAIAFYEVSVPRRDRNRSERPDREKPKPDAQRQQKIDRFVDDYFARFDRNNDDRIIRDELPTALKRFAFEKFDHDGNGYLSRDEIRTEAERRF